MALYAIGLRFHFVNNIYFVTEYAIKSKIHGYYYLIKYEYINESSRRQALLNCFVKKYFITYNKEFQ